MTRYLSPIPLYRSIMEENMPDCMIESTLQVCNGNLVVNGNWIKINSKINILAYGKASRLMYKAAKKIIGNEYFGKGLLITHEDKKIQEIDGTREVVIKSTHPLITKSSYIAGNKAKEFVENGHGDDILLVLISGGGSAMVALPIDSISLSDKIKFISTVMHMSVPEREVNVLKKALSKIKGGKLAELATEKTIVNCVLSDERDHQISAISSGMTVCNKLIDPIDVMDTYKLWDIAENPVKKALIDHGCVTGIGCDKNIINQIVGSRDTLVASFVKRYAEFGFDSVNFIDNMHSCTPEDAANNLIENFYAYYESANSGKHLIVSTGEVQVNAEQFPNAKGGRNQHLVALLMLTFKPNFNFFFTAIATDGVDYLDGVHGAYYDSQMNQTIERNQDLIQSNISELNSYKIHKELQTLLEGPKTGTNMSDFFLFTFEKKAKSKK